MNNNTFSGQFFVAIKCAEQGWLVIPVGKDGKPFPVRGWKDATTDVAMIAAWWTQWPTALVGIVCSKDVSAKSRHSLQSVNEGMRLR